MKQLKLLLLIPFSVSLSPVLAANVPPFDDSTFWQVLDDSRLQGPGSNTILNGDLVTGPPSPYDGYASNQFRLASTSKDDYMTFQQSGDSKRSELRQLIEWQTSTSSYRKMIGEVKVFFPSTGSLNEFTFMQVHDSGSYPNKPLIRLAWIRNRDGFYDWLWCIRRTSVGSSTYIKTPLIPRPSGFFKAEILVINNELRVKINGSTKVDADVSYWDGLNSYFKAGVYLQDPGTAKTQFRRLNYYYN
jgi:hypothetical protein